MLVRAKSISILTFAAIASMASASTARAQEESTLAVGVSYTARAADASGEHGSNGIGFAWGLGHGGARWGWSDGLGWFSADIDRTVGGQSIDLGELHVRPRLTVRNSLGEESVRLRADMIVVSTGLVYKIF
jgi:hypothetical protein